MPLLLIMMFLCLPGCTGDGDDTAGGGGGDADAGSSDAGSSDAGASDGGSGDGGSGDGGVDEDAMDDNLRSPAGAFALDYLLDDTYDQVLIEIDHVAGRAPTDAALDAMLDMVEEFCHKPGGLVLQVDDEIPDQGAPVWTYEAAEALEITWRDNYRDPASGTAVVYFLYLDGSSEYDTDAARILGYAYHGSSLIMFKDAMDAADPGLPGLVSIGEVVATHELGHILGLVDNGVEMVNDHRDYDHGNHDVDEDCLMYWSANTDLVADLLGTRLPELDDECRRDLAAAGGKDTL